MKATQNPPTAAQVTPADVLRMAALYLRRHGWHQGTYYALTEDDNPFPPACVAGAIGMAAHGHLNSVPHQHSNARDYSRALDALSCYLLDAGPDPVRLYGDDVPNGDPFEWNDRPGRTAEQVTTALDAAADEWDRLHTDGGDNR
ncbi:hypothetical protein C1I95_27150 [Micromonospora craterilacus]|uniref:Uncharacterized protein n=1 Tax=Micromonospora craterilacus TaxID=1655439 RepID=A0A2W2DHY3_9ACTN|nr:hypothetical protein [Micromonospora craterilacus]PZG11532.1 hypothetical protein C1I95_27150 [Micromonospora craterilacus]